MQAEELDKEGKRNDLRKEVFKIMSQLINDQSVWYKTQNFKRYFI